MRRVLVIIGCVAMVFFSLSEVAFADGGYFVRDSYKQMAKNFVKVIQFVRKECDRASKDTVLLWVMQHSITSQDQVFNGMFYPGSSMKCNGLSGTFASPNGETYYFLNGLITKVEFTANSLQYEISPVFERTAPNLHDLEVTEILCKISDGKNYIKMALGPEIVVDAQLSVITENALVLNKSPLATALKSANELSFLLTKFYHTAKGSGIFGDNADMLSFAEAMLLSPEVRDSFIKFVISIPQENQKKYEGR